MNQNKEFFHTILEQHKGIIHKVANSYCKDVVDRQDLIQEIILQIWYSIDKYNEQFKMSTWIYRISLNTAISFYRKNKRRQENTIGFSSIIESSESLKMPISENSNIKFLYQFIYELKDIDKALVLLYLDGLQYAEIAAVIGISISNVSTKMHRIKGILKEKFSNLKNTKS